MTTEYLTNEWSDDYDTYSNGLEVAVLGNHWGFTVDEKTIIFLLYYTRYD